MSANTPTKASVLFDLPRLVLVSLPDYNEEIKRVLGITRVPVSADRADTLNGQNVEEITYEAREVLRLHTLKKDNPHNETPLSMDLRSASEIEDYLSNVVPSNLISISSFGYDVYSWTESDLASEVSLNGPILDLPSNQTVLFNGLPYTVFGSTVDLSTLSSSWENTTFYIYLNKTESLVNYQVTNVKYHDTLEKTYIGKVNSNTGIVNLVRVIKIGKYRLSTSPVGTGIPIGLGEFDSSYGIDRGWIPAKNYVRPDIPPKVSVSLVSYKKSNNGRGGYITNPDMNGLLYIETYSGELPYIDFLIEGEGATSFASVDSVSGTKATVNKINGNRYTVTAGSLGVSLVTITARIPDGSTDSYSFYVKIRSNLSLSISSTPGMSEGALSGTSATINLNLRGDGATTSGSITTLTAPGLSLNKTSNTSYRVTGTNPPGRSLVHITAVDIYGNSSNVTMNVYIPVPTGSRSFTSSGSFTVPNFVKSMTIYVSGGGGGGGGGGGYGYLRLGSGGKSGGAGSPGTGSKVMNMSVNGGAGGAGGGGASYGDYAPTWGYNGNAGAGGGGRAGGSGGRGGSGIPGGGAGNGGAGGNGYATSGVFVVTPGQVITFTVGTGGSGGAGGSQGGWGYYGTAGATGASGIVTFSW